MPGIPVRPKDLPGHVERMKALIAARKEMLDIVAKQRSITALKPRVTNAENLVIQVQDEFLMFHEKPVGKRVGPYSVQRFPSDDKLLERETGDRLTTASIDNGKLYRSTKAPMETAS